MSIIFLTAHMLLLTTHMIALPIKLVPMLIIVQDVPTLPNSSPPNHTLLSLVVDI